MSLLITRELHGDCIEKPGEQPYPIPHTRQHHVSLQVYTATHWCTSDFAGKPVPQQITGLLWEVHVAQHILYQAVVTSQLVGALSIEASFSSITSRHIPQHHPALLHCQLLLV